MSVLSGSYTSMSRGQTRGRNRRVGRAVGILVGALAVLALALPAGALAGIAKDPQTIIWDSWPTSATNGQLDFWIQAHSDGGEYVTLSADGSCYQVGSGIDANNDSSIYVETTSAGTCTIYASAPGDIVLYPVTTERSFVVDPGKQHFIFETDPSTWHGSWGGLIEMPVHSFNLRGEPTGLPVEIKTSTPDKCSPSQANGTNWVRTREPGTCTIYAYQAGNSDYWSSTSDTYSFTIGKVDQQITFYPISTKMPGEEFLLSGVWASSGKLVTLTSAPGCGVTQYQVFVSQTALSCTITAHQDGDDHYNAATQVSQTFYVGEVGVRAGAVAVSQWEPSAPLDRYGADGHGYDGSSGGWDWCADFAHWVWRNSGVNIPPAFEAPGSTSADLPHHAYTHHNVNWFLDYGSVYGRLRDTPAIGDAIVFGDSPGGGVAHVAIVTWVSPNGSAIDFVGGNQAGGDGHVTKVAGVPSAIGDNTSGLYILHYVEPMDSGTASTADTIYSMQTGQAATGSFAVAASAGSSSNLDIIVGPFFSNVDLQLHRPNGTLVSPGDPGVTVTKLANSIEVAITGAGPGVWQYEIDAVQLEPGGEDIHIQASTTPAVTTVATQDNPESQYLQPATFTALMLPPIDGGATPTGTVQFNLDGNPAGPPVALDSAGQATWTTSNLSVGSHTVSVDYLGSDPLVAPSSATITHSVTKADQTIAFDALAGKTYGDADFSVSATASSGLPVSLAAAGTCTVSGTTVHITAAGSCTITASQAGDGNYNAAPDVAQSFAIAKADQAITFGALAGKTYGDADFSVSATASSGLTVGFAAAGNCTLSGTTVHIVSAGTCTITASQAGDSNYNPAPDVPQKFSIAKKALTITANDATKPYGQTLSFAGTEFSVAGLVPGDGVASVTLASNGQPVGAQPGSYPIVASAAVGTGLANYDISYRNGTLTVNLVALVGLDSVTVNGSGKLDSYDGGTGPYTGKAPNSAAFVVSNGAIAVNGSATVRGDIRSTQGSVSLTESTVVTGNVSAGTTIPTTSPIRGLASPNSPVPALVAPAVGACSPYSSGAGLSGSFNYDPATGNLSVSGSKTATLAAGDYCFGSISLSGSARLVVSGPVTLRLTGTFSQTGSSVVNATGNAASLQISTSYAGRNGVAISGSGIAHFTVYAPAAQVVISGSPEISGLVLGKSISLSGSAAIHEDTSLGGVWAGFYRN